MARPKVDIDAEEVMKLAQLGCKVKEIASWFGVNEDTILRRFADELDKGRTNLKMSLRRKQLDVALKGNIAMLIWLGKQCLDQSDKLDQNNHNIHLVEQARELTNLSKDELVKIAKSEIKRLSGKNE